MAMTKEHNEILARCRIANLLPGFCMQIICFHSSPQTPPPQPARAERPAMVHHQVPQYELGRHPMMTIFRNGDPSLGLLFLSLTYGSDFLCSTSRWRSRHIIALKVIQLTEQPISRLAHQSSSSPETVRLLRNWSTFLCLPPSSRVDAMIPSHPRPLFMTPSPLSCVQQAKLCPVTLH